MHICPRCGGPTDTAFNCVGICSQMANAQGPHAPGQWNVPLQPLTEQDVRRIVREELAKAKGVE